MHAIDCDLHVNVPSMSALAPYLDETWREIVKYRGINSLDSIAYPANSPLSARPDWRHREGVATSPRAVAADTLDRWNIDHAICNCLYGVQLIFDEAMAAAFARAVNNWVLREWVHQDHRLRASIIAPLQNVELAVDEIERCATDERFVQVLVLVMGEAPLGRRQFWPVYKAAERHHLPICIHAGSSYKHPVTSIGWPTYYIEDYISQSQGFQAQLASLICEGVFAKFPNLKVVLAESGVTWLPGFLWRFSKFWRGLRSEVPWVDRPPTEIVRDHIRLTMAPFDAPDESRCVERLIEQLGSDEMLLFSTDYPHWHFDGDDIMPAGVPEWLRRKAMVENPLATYARLRESVR